jgi:hypothetical protein
LRQFAAKLNVMIKSPLLALILVCSVALQAASPSSPVAAITFDLEQLMSWLPADTETVAVARGPFVLAASAPSENDTQDRVISDKDLSQSFEDLSLGLLQFKNGLLAKRLEGKRITLEMEGSRHFRPPSGLGEMPYEGCAIVVFSENLHTEIASFAKDASSSTLKVERIENQDVSVFQEKWEQDTWTTFVAFPNDHVVLVATDRNYLAEVLVRIQGKNGQRALPNDLPEWKYVNTDARFWGLRHYDKSQAQTDPTSPIAGRKSANFPDEQAIGLTFVFDPQRGRSAKITYLSGDTSLGSKPSESPLGMARAPEAKGLDIKYRELSPGVVEGTYSLEHLQAVQFFLFELEADLGHAIYL